MINAVIIDFDDTLCLTEAACFDLENETLVSMGREPMSRDIHKQTWGRPLFEAIADRSPGINVEDFREAFKPVIAAYIKSGQLDSIPQSNYETLDKLITQGMSIMILTSRTHTEVEHLLQKDHLLASRVQTFYYRDNMKFHKPDPRAFDELLSANGLQPSQCVYVGDSLSDAEAAKGAGLHFIASVESGLRQKQDFQSLPVDAFIDRFSDLYAAVQSLEG